jgi:hypothetical protein
MENNDSNVSDLKVMAAMKESASLIKTVKYMRASRENLHNRAEI